MTGRATRFRSRRTASAMSGVIRSYHTGNPLGHSRVRWPAVETPTLETTVVCGKNPSLLTRELRHSMGRGGSRGELSGRGGGGNGR